MGCKASKRVKSSDDAYKLAPSSFAVFDINAIEEPWLIVDNTNEEQPEKPKHVPAPILDKLNKLEFNGNAPHSWDEVSKALEDLKPAINGTTTTAKDNRKIPDATSAPKPVQQLQDSSKKQPPRKSLSFHTVEELDAKLSSSNGTKPKPAATKSELRKTESMRTEATRAEVKMKAEFAVNKGESEAESAVGGGGVIKPVKENIFIVRDRLEKEREGKQAQLDRVLSKRDPLSEFPEKCPPGGTHSLVVYTTSLRGVRRTYEDCNKARGIFELNGVVFDERDVSLHGEFLTELKELLGEEVSVPRVFVKGRYLGGVEEVSELNESGRLGRLLTLARVERGLGRRACEGCGGARFVPCLDCGGSCKVFNGDKKERCGMCNENGLVHCPSCH